MTVFVTQLFILAEIEPATSETSQTSPITKISMQTIIHSFFTCENLLRGKVMCQDRTLYTYFREQHSQAINFRYFIGWRIKPWDQ